MTTFPNIYGRKPSAILNGDGKVAETYPSRRQARRARPALAREMERPTGSLRIVANGAQVSDVMASMPVSRNAQTATLSPRRAHSTPARMPDAKPQGWQRRISTY